MSLRYGSEIEPHPRAYLSGWFERRLNFWSVRRWLELDGSMLTYRHRQSDDPVWKCDLREARMSAGSSACEIILQRPGCGALSLFAPSLDELKLWFGQMKSVSDCVGDFYHFSAKIGHTRHGTIYLGCDRKNHEDVAIHTTNKANLPLPKMTLMTKRDLSVVAATQTHECILRVIDIFESTMRFFTVVELLSGGPLEDLLSSPLTEATACDIMADILHGLQHLHSHDVVHGNLDGHHILSTSRSLPCRVKIVAFGVATARRNGRLPDTTLCDWQTLAPEVICFNRCTAASDVFSAGILLFRMLSGTTPFSTKHKSEYLACVSQGLALEGKVWERVSEDGKSLVRQMLAEDVSIRPSATECLDCEWFRRSLLESDCADLEDPLARLPSDPKTVIMDFEMGPSTSAVRTGGAIRSSIGDDAEVLSYEKLD